MRRRDKRIEIYFNDEELNKLDTDREELGLSRSEYLRLLVLGNVINKKSNKEILNTILELQNIKDYLKKIDTQIEKDEEVNPFIQTVLKDSLNNLNNTMEKLNTKIE